MSSTGNNKEEVDLEIEVVASHTSDIMEFFQIGIAFIHMARMAKDKHVKRVYKHMAAKTAEWLCTNVLEKSLKEKSAVRKQNYLKEEVEKAEEEHKKRIEQKMMKKAIELDEALYGECA